MLKATASLDALPASQQVDDLRNLLQQVRLVQDYRPLREVANRWGIRLQANQKNTVAQISEAIADAFKARVAALRAYQAGSTLAQVDGAAARKALKVHGAIDCGAEALAEESVAWHRPGVTPAALGDAARGQSSAAAACGLDDAEQGADDAPQVPAEAYEESGRSKHQVVAITQPRGTKRKS